MQDSQHVQINKEYEKLVPSLTENEFFALKESIKKNGLYHPIIKNEFGVILDGHHRYVICQELHISPKYDIQKFDNKLLEKKFIIETNLVRRQLNDFQKVELGIPLHRINEDIAKAHQGFRSDLTSMSNNIGEPFNSNKETAKEIGVSKGTFERAKKIIINATDEIKEKLRTGATTIGKEYQKLQQHEKKEKRQAEIKNLQVNLPEKALLYNYDFRNASIPFYSVSLIITSLPFTKNQLSLLKDLAKQASKFLRENGSLCCFIEQQNIPEAIKIMEENNLKFQWSIAVIHGGLSKSDFSRKVIINHKPLLWFVKGKYDGEFVKDVIYSEFQGKELHDGAQSTVESDYCIECMTMENDIVYDPFLGQGTFGISAISQNRQFIGCEVDKEHFENARRLISAASQT